MHPAPLGQTATDRDTHSGAPIPQPTVIDASWDLPDFNIGRPPLLKSLPRVGCRLQGSSSRECRGLWRRRACSEYAWQLREWCWDGHCMTEGVESGCWDRHATQGRQHIAA